MKKTIAILMLYTSFAWADTFNFGPSTRAEKKAGEMLSQQTQLPEGYQPPEKPVITEQLKESVQHHLNGRKSLSDKERITVDQIGEIMGSEEFKQQQEAWRKQIATSIGISDWEAPKQQKNDQTMIFSDRAILFISSSMPMPALQRYAQDLEKIDGVMVMRGGIDGLSNIKKTMTFIASVLRKDKSCQKEPCEKYTTPILIDPVLVREYQVKRVPALAIHGRTNLASYCDNSTQINAGNHLVYGDSNLKYLIERIYTETKKPAHASLISQLGY